MYTFIISLAALIIGFVLYGTLVERVFHIQPERTTPANSHTDGVDYVPMSGWRIFLVQFLNIAGLGPIFGAIMGICFGPSAFLWIVFGTIFAGGVHDYMSGMLSLRQDGASLPEIVGSQLGSGVKIGLRLFTPVLLVLLTTVFLSGPAGLLQRLCELPTMEYHNIPIAWVLIIFAYYTLATILPVDKLIGRFYPLFGAILLFMGIGIMIVMLGWHSSEMPELTDGLHNRQTDGLPLFPMMFVSIACGAISGFHGTQSPLMARCLTNERQGRWIFYGAMACEGILALIWAAAAGTFQFQMDNGELVSIHEYLSSGHTAANVVSQICVSWLGKLGGLLAIIGVIAAPITSGDTALRSARLILADFLHLDQKVIAKRFIIALPLFACVFGMVFVDFAVVWRYFAWTNQTIAVFTLWAATLWLFKQEHQTSDAPMKWGYMMTLIPAVFMTMVSISYILIAPEGLHLPPEWRWIGYMVAAVITTAFIAGFCVWARKYETKQA